MTPRPRPRAGQVSEVKKMWDSTNFGKSRYTGFAAYPKAAKAHENRITSLSGRCILSELIVLATGRMVPQNEPFCEITEPTSIDQLVELCYLDKRVIQAELKYMRERKIIRQKQVRKGLYEFQPLFRTWDSIPDYVPQPMEVAGDDEPMNETEEEPLPEDPARNDRDSTVTRLTPKPVRIAAGKKSKPVKVECGVTALQFHSNVDAECSAVVEGGVLLVSLTHENEAKSQGSRSNGFNNITTSPRTYTRDDSSETRGKRTKGERGTKGEQAAVLHPRAEELSALFDPLIHKWCGKTLSGDPQALLQACNAIGDTPHDVLVHDSVERAGRNLIPLHTIALCKEIAHNWRKSKDMPVQKKLPTREEIDAMVAADREKRLAKEREILASRRRRRSA